MKKLKTRLYIWNDGDSYVPWNITTQKPELHSGKLRHTSASNKSFYVDNCMDEEEVLASGITKEMLPGDDEYLEIELSVIGF